MAKERTLARGKREPAGAKARKKIQTIFPASFRSHLKASIRESLLAFGSLFEEAVNALEKDGRKESRKKSRKIKVD